LAWVVLVVLPDRIMALLEVIPFSPQSLQPEVVTEEQTVQMEEAVAPVAGVAVRRFHLEERAIHQAHLRAKEIMVAGEVIKRGNTAPGVVVEPVGQVAAALIRQRVLLVLEVRHQFQVHQ
jgi:hypothetical protein